MRETKNLEFKENLTNTFLKTVSAFANYGTGQIKFGIKDNGTVVGVTDPEKLCLDIENKINDAIKPHPNYELAIDPDTKVVTLTVKQGIMPPYFYKSKAYKRNDSSSIEVDPLELSRLILVGQNRSYDGLPASTQALSFSVLENNLKEKIGIKKLTEDILITLDLKRREEGYTIAAELLSDKNSYRGIDLIRFGADVNTILDRDDYSGQSILQQYTLTLQKFCQYYQHEKIIGATRENISLIPVEAFREAVANALVHRTWDVNSQIKISMFDDRIEVVSPGGLPEGITEKEYLQGQLSVLRNPIIANVFFRLGLIEQFGTGIKRILSSYKDSIVQPQFDIGSNHIRIILPIVQTSVAELSDNENSVYQVLQTGEYSTAKIAQMTGFGRTKTLKILNALINKGYASRKGNGRNTKYRKAN